MQRNLSTQHHRQMDEILTLPRHIEEPDSDEDDPLPSLHAHIFGSRESVEPSIESLSPSPSRTFPSAGSPVTDQNDTVEDDEIRSIPPNADQTMLESIQMRGRRQRRQRGRESSRGRSRSRERDRAPAGMHISRRREERLDIPCPICERDDESAEALNDFIINSVIGKKSMMAICRIAWKRLSLCDRRGGTRFATPTVQDVSYHARTCLSHPNIIIRMEIDKWKGVGEDLHAASKIGETSSGASLFDPKFVTNAKIASDELRKWLGMVDHESKSLRATTTQKNRGRIVRNPLY